MVATVASGDDSESSHACSMCSCPGCPPYMPESPERHWIHNPGSDLCWIQLINLINQKIIFCEVENHEAFGFCEIVGREGNEEANGNEGNEGSAHDGDTGDSDDNPGSGDQKVDSDGFSGSLETRK